MRKYEEYKNVELRYFESIPVNWKLGRLCDVLSSKNYSFTGGPFGSDLKSNDYTDDGIRIIQLQNIGVGKFLNDYKIYTSEEKANVLLACNIYPGDIIISKMADPVARATIIPDYHSRYLMASDGIRLVNNNFNDSRFLVYAINSIHFNFYASINSVGSTRQRIGLNVLKKLNIILPTLQEQQAIANYLDAKTQAIDKKVSLLEQKIETYKKLKNTIIAKAVTQGISNQELSINDLGFKTPANWTKYRLKDLGKLFSGLSGKSGDDFNQEDNPNNRGFIPFTNIANNTYLKKDHLGTVVINPGEKQNKVRKGDLFFLMSSEGYGDIGKTAVLADDIDEAYLNSFCKGYRVNQNKCNPYFLNYLLLSNIYRQRLIVEGKGFTRINLKMEKVTDFEIFLPPTLSEQEEIANYLDHKTTTIDAIVSNIGKQIDTLKQLRKTFINDVVTGKIKVIE